MAEGPTRNQTSINVTMAITSVPLYNNTTSAMESSPSVPGSDAASLAAVLVPIVFGIIFCVGFIANLAVIVVNISTFHRQTRGLRITYAFILNLAIADLFFLVFCVPFQATIYSMDGWPFGGFMCIFCEVCQEVAMLASIYTLVALSLDRFFAVVYATSAKQIRTDRNVVRCLVVIWMAALALGIPSAATKVGVTFKDQLICATQWYGIYDEVIFACGYVMPLINIVICYVAVLYSLKMSEKNAAAGRASRKKNRKVTRLVVLLVIVFALSWLPHHVTVLWVKLGDFPYTGFTFALRVTAHCLSYANSCLNPLIYGCVCATFRRSVSRGIAKRPDVLRFNMSQFSTRFSTNFSLTSVLSRSVASRPRSPKAARSTNRVACASLRETTCHMGFGRSRMEMVPLPPIMPLSSAGEEIVVLAI